MKTMTSRKLFLHFSVFFLLLFFDLRPTQSNPVVEGSLGYDGESPEDERISSDTAEAALKKKRRFDCPMCDSSVFSYCSDKLLHDACCCLNPYESQLPHQCKYADCSFLHANSCQEHHLITACCCNKNYAYNSR